MKLTIFFGIASMLLIQTVSSYAQPDPVPPANLANATKQLALYLNHNFAGDPNFASIDQNLYSNHTLWEIDYLIPGLDGFITEYDLENNCLIRVSDDIVRTSSEASKLAGAPISVTAAQAKQVAQNLHQFLAIGGDWRSVDTFLSFPNSDWTCWYFKYSLFVNGYYSREENALGGVNAYDGRLIRWVRRDPRTYVPVTSPLFSFNQAQQIASNIAQRNVIVQEVRGLSTQTDPLWTVVDYDIQTTPVCRLAYVFEVVPLPGESQSPRAIAIDAQTGESWLQMSALYTMGDAHKRRESPKLAIKSERFQMIDRLARDKSLAPLLRSIASGNLMKQAPKEKFLEFERVAGQSHIAFKLYPKSRVLSWTASTGKKAGVQLSKPEMTLLQRWLSVKKSTTTASSNESR